MRISDWSSDVCSSDLSPEQPNRAERLINVRIRPVPVDRTLLEGCAHSGDGRFGQWVCGNYTASPLAFRAREGRPAALHDPRDRPAAFASLALAPIDAPVLGAIAQVDRKSTRLNSSH